ncbi:MAG: M12 family metallopeptidase [Bacteroidota bacterium]
MKQSIAIIYHFSIFIISLLISQKAVAQEIHACVVMPAPAESISMNGSSGFNLPRGAQSAVALGGPGNSGFRSNYWPAGSTIRVKFLGGSTLVRQKVMRYAQEWTRYANINFQFVGSGTGDIRISFDRNGSSWSMLGRQALNAPANRPTMNFGWFTDSTPEYEFRRTVLHEFGHALGLLHEHQNPVGGIPWNEQAVYDFYWRTQGWNQQTTYQNVMARQNADETQYSAYDAQSIMHYPIPTQLTHGSYEVGLNTTISPTDAAFIARAYPGRRFFGPTEGNNGEDKDSKATSGGDRSSPPVTTPARMAEFNIGVTNTLGRSVRAETVELTIDGSVYTYRLSERRRTEQTMRMRLRPGTYDYSIRSASVYTGQERVWNGRRYVNQRQERTIYGNGSGQLQVSKDSNLVFYGRYDESTGRMTVWLGEG